MGADVLMLDETEKSVLRAFLLRGVRHLVIGGHAVRVHGYRRSTNDLDIVVDPSPENAARVTQAVSDLGFKGDEAFASGLTQPKKKLTLARYGCDILTSIEGRTFEELYRDKVLIAVDGIEVGIISKEHLVEMKDRSDRAKDQRDHRHLTKARRAG